MTKILIVGIGGVGGYFGGLLAKHFENHPSVEIYFLARGKHLEMIQRNGLHVIHGESEFIAHPKLATDDPNHLEKMDFILLCTKSYDLEATVEQLRPCINGQTVIVPFLNGVDAKERIKSILPNQEVTDGCAYIISRLVDMGKVENSGNIQKLFFGIQARHEPRLQMLEKFLLEAGIEAKCSEAIETIVWEKFIFISATATATSFFDESIGAIVSDDEKLKVVEELVQECMLIAESKNISISKDMVQKVLNILRSLPYESTSSLHSDIKDGKEKTEIQSLIQFVVDEGIRKGVRTETYTRLLEQITS